MKGLGKLAREKDLRIQSHLSENHSEIEWVKELVPELDSDNTSTLTFVTLGKLYSAVLIVVEYILLLNPALSSTNEYTV